MPVPEAQDRTIPLATVLNRIAVEQSRLAGLVLALQDMLSPESATAWYDPEAIRSLQSVDLVTQTLNDLARLTLALADGVGTPARRDAGGMPGGVPGSHSERAPGVQSGGEPGLARLSDTAAGMFGLVPGIEIDPAPLRAFLTLGDLAARILGFGDSAGDEDESDVFWLGEIAVSDRREGAA